MLQNHWKDNLYEKRDTFVPLIPTRERCYIFGREPEILDPQHLRRALTDLRRIGDVEAEKYIAEACQKVLATVQDGGYKYGLGE